MFKLNFALAVAMSLVLPSLAQASLSQTLYCSRFTCPVEQTYVFPRPKPKPYYTVEATVTAYNTVEWQTDGSPCDGAAGWVCGRQVVACPRSIPLHTWVEIVGVGKFECMDRLNARYTNRFDLSFDKDIKAALQWGIQTKTIKVYAHQ